MEKLYCPHCDDFHFDEELIIDNDYIICKKTNEEIKTYKLYKGSESITRWRKEHNLECY